MEGIRFVAGQDRRHVETQGVVRLSRRAQRG